VKQTFTESIGGISPLDGGAIDGSRRPVPKTARARSQLQATPGVAVAHACPECDFVTTDAAEAARHLTLLVTGNSVCGVARSRLRPGKRQDLPLGPAITAYLETVANERTAAVYGSTLRLLAERFGTDTAVGDIPRGQLAAWFRDRWEGVSASTWNGNATALKSFFAFCRSRGWCDMPDGLVRRRTIRRGPLNPPGAAEIRRVLGGRGLGLRERSLWLLLFDSAAKPGEALALSVEDLDLAGRRAVVGSYGRLGVISWGFDTNRLLVELTAGRSEGPVFLTGRRAKGERASGDIDAASGKGRLSYRRAAEIFEEATAGEQGGPWTLHQLRDAALADAARNGADMPTLEARSRCIDPGSIERYAYA
jgi:integrase